MTAYPSIPAPAPAALLRPPSEVMRLARMGASFPTRLSFMRVLIRRLNAEQARVTRPIWEIDDQGHGRAVYSVPLDGDTYSLVAFSTPLAPESRTDRVIAEAWDTTYVLYDGVPTPAELDRLQQNVPRQEAGRYRATELVLARANRSVRLFEHVVASLAAGRQPDAGMLDRVGYLMRTTAVYGNGKFGIADRARIAGRPALAGPFQAEMLTVWLIRGFTLDLAEHVAKTRDPERFVALAPRLGRHLGIGNATGLGMAPFLVSHPVLVNNWMLARETALARVRAVAQASPKAIARFRELLGRARCHVAAWNVEDARQMARIEQLRRDLTAAEALFEPEWLAEPRPWNRLVEASARFSPEAQEMLASLAIEPHGALVDGLASAMASPTGARLEPAMSLKDLRILIEAHFGWAMAVDFEAPEAQRRFWYTSEEKLEPRLGDRYAEPGAAKEMPLDIARQVQRLGDALTAGSPSGVVADFLLHHPELRHVVRRVQAAAHCPYSEIRDNLIGADCLPIDILRCKLAFFGATKFDPKSDRWTRITMYQGAPGFAEIRNPNADDWAFPVLEGTP